MHAKKQRLDLLLTEKGLVPTRAKAQALILAGRVKVDDEVVRKSGVTIPIHKKITLIDGPRFVSRGGDKLKGALEDFGLSPDGQQCMDVGSSTGGFTDCLLKSGASTVFCVDVGRGQLDVSLRNDKRVVVKEETHILDVLTTDVPWEPSFVVVDVSFISLRKVLNHIKSLAATTSTFLVLIKPQFEVGPKQLKNGVVRSVEIQQATVQEIIDFSQSLGFECKGHRPSKLRGPKGNQEYFAWLTKGH